MDLDPRNRRVPAASSQEQQVPPWEYPDPGVGSTAAQFSRERWGLPTRVLRATPSGATTAADVLGADAKRLFWIVINRGTSDVNLDVGSDAVAGNGVLLAAGGGYASMDVLEDAEAIVQRVSVVAASGTPQLYTLQVLAI